MPSQISIERLTVVGGKHSGLMDVEAHILSSKNQTKTTAVVTLTINVEDDPKLSVIQQRILSHVSRNLTPDEVETEQ